MDLFKGAIDKAVAGVKARLAKIDHNKNNIPDIKELDTKLDNLLPKLEKLGELFPRPALSQALRLLFPKLSQEQADFALTAGAELIDVLKQLHGMSEDLKAIEADAKPTK